MKKISVVTGTRADYGLLYWTIKGIIESKKLELDLIVTGMHLSEKFGNTVEEIERDFKISKKVNLGELTDSVDSMVNQVSKGIKEFSKAFVELEADLVLILGDRYEMLSAAQAAMLNSIPIAHIHGGEITEGAIDDLIRHSISKMSQLHFATTEVYRRRLVQMGEKPTNVFNVGAPGLENITKLDLLSKEKLSKEINFEMKEKNFLITFHPVTAHEEKGIDELISVLSEYKDIGQIVTLPNSDPGHDVIFEKWKEYSDVNPNVFLTESLGRLRYLSAMNVSNVVIGNSSSGLLEAPFCGTPTVNIGSRQKGRLRDNSVLDCSACSVEIKNMIDKALSLKYEQGSVYGDGNTSSKIVQTLEQHDVKFVKEFYDLEKR